MDFIQGVMDRLSIRTQLVYSSSLDVKGKKNKDKHYPAVTGVKSRNCNFCPYKTNYELCPVENRTQTLSE